MRIKRNNGGKVFGTTPTCSLNSKEHEQLCHGWFLTLCFDFHSCSHHHILFAWSLPRWQKYTITTYTVAFLSSVSGTSILPSSSQSYHFPISFHFPCSFHFSRPISYCLLPIKLAPKVSVFPGDPGAANVQNNWKGEAMMGILAWLSACQNLH